MQTLAQDLADVAVSAEDEAVSVAAVDSAEAFNKVATAAAASAVAVAMEEVAEVSREEVDMEAEAIKAAKEVAMVAAAALLHLSSHPTPSPMAHSLAASQTPSSTSRT